VNSNAEQGIGENLTGFFLGAKHNGKLWFEAPLKRCRDMDFSKLMLDQERTRSLFFGQRYFLVEARIDYHFGELA
jgi:hypothetical protein